MKKVYDPTCGSGSLLLHIAQTKKNKVSYYGQELNKTSFDLSRMNMIMHNIDYDKFDIRRADTLESPQHVGQKFDRVFANPPYSADWSMDDKFKTDKRFSAVDKLAPKGKADWAFVQHMWSQLSTDGIMGVVLPHGVLFRGGAEGKIREHFIQKLNGLDAVIGLPVNMFYGTTIPTCILIFKKCREEDNNILFIDASNEFEKQKTQNTLLQHHINKIIDTFKSRETIDKYSYLASLDEVKENGYNLNIPRYVDTFEEEEPVDLDAVSAELKAIDTEMADTDNTIASFCDELGIAKPF
jgi:type I restriction enzyme M protein